MLRIGRHCYGFVGIRDITLGSGVCAQEKLRTRRLQVSMHEKRWSVIERGQTGL